MSEEELHTLSAVMERAGVTLAREELLGLTQSVEDLGERQVGKQMRRIAQIRYSAFPERTRDFGPYGLRKLHEVTIADYGPGRDGGKRKSISWVSAQDPTEEERARNRENIYRAFAGVLRDMGLR